ncbi:MAG: YceH family protein [Candidatus Sumerlaeota bacterium]|nr:YceH family protein [Candidatus Sumerlaeota bacterium]
MEIMLTSDEARVLGSLIEKEITTPIYYPMTLNALTNACSQRSNRDPVVFYRDEQVLDILDALREKKLITKIIGDFGRVPKFREELAAALKLSPPETAVVCVLMLRGHQTLGEIRQRCERMHSFANLSETETTLNQLIARSGGPLVMLLPRQPGQKENRYAHLLCGQPEAPEAIDSQARSAAESPISPARSASPASPAPVAVEESKTIESSGLEARLAQLEEKVAEQETELSALREAFVEFKKQFE